jgi:hypothetical protein
VSAKAGVFIPISTSYSGRGATQAERDMAKLQGTTAATSRAVGAETGKANKALATLTGGFQATGQGSKLMGLAVAGGTALAAGAVIGFATKSAKAYLTVVGSAREFQRVAGGTAEQASALAFATRRMGLEPEAAAKAYFQLSKRLGTGQVDLAKYGITVKHNADGSVDLKDATLKLAGALQKVDANKRAAAVFELFGKGGAALLPILGKTKGELQDIFALAGKDHQIFSQKDFDQAASYKKSLAEMQLAWQGVQVQIGRGVIPVMQSFTDLITPVAGFAGDNADALGLLAKIVGGPLLAALVAITGVKIIGFFTEGLGAVRAFGAGILEQVGVLATGRIAMEGFAAEATATEGAVAASSTGIGASLAAAGAGAASLAAGVATIDPASLSAVLALVIPDDNAVDRAWRKVSKSERLAVASSVADAQKQGKGYQFITGELDKYGKRKNAIWRQINALPKEGLFDDESAASKRLWGELNRLEAKHDALKATLKVFRAEVHAVGGEAGRTSTQIDGLRVPNDVLASFDSKGLKTFRTDLAAATDTFNAWNVQLLLSSGVGGAALKSLTKDAQQTDQAITSSFSSATTVVGAFGNSTAISGDQFMAKLREMQNQAMEFAAGLKLAAALGVDQGLLKEIAAAGPKAEPELLALLDAVRTNGVGAINQTRTDTNAALAGIVGTINGRIAQDGAAAAAYGIAMGDAIMHGLAGIIAAQLPTVVQSVVNAFRGLAPVITGAPGSGGAPGVPHNSMGGHQSGASSADVWKWVAAGGHLAAGGPVEAGRAFVGNERGEEVFVSTLGGRVLSHGDAMRAVSAAASTSVRGPGGLSAGNSGGFNLTIAVDARGATDPAATKAAAERGAKAGSDTLARNLTRLSRTN